MKEKILISTGGSGGHVMPALTIHDHLKNRYDIKFSTDLRGLKYLSSNDHKIYVIDTPKFDKIIFVPISIIKTFFLTLKSLILLKRALRIPGLV